MVWIADSARYLSFGKSRTIAKLFEKYESLSSDERREADRYHFTAVLFDIVRLDGEDLTGLPLSVRRSRLMQLVQVQPHRVIIHPFHECM